MGSEIKIRENIARGIVISLTLSAILYSLKVRSLHLCQAQCCMSMDGVVSISIHPFADMAILLGLNWLAILLYMEAVVSPFGTGVSFVAVTGRVTRYGRKWAYS